MMKQAYYDETYKYGTNPNVYVTSYLLSFTTSLLILSFCPREGLICTSGKAKSVWSCMRTKVGGSATIRLAASSIQAAWPAAAAMFKQLQQTVALEA